MNGRALVARNLRRIKVKRGLSQERLGFDAAVNRSYTGGLECEEENPTRLQPPAPRDIQPACDLVVRLVAL